MSKRRGNTVRNPSSQAHELMKLTRQADRSLIAGLILTHVLVGIGPASFILGSTVFATGLLNSATSAMPPTVYWCAAAFILGQAVTPFQVTLGLKTQMQVDGYVSRKVIESVMNVGRLPDSETPTSRADLEDSHQTLLAREFTPGAAVEGSLALVARYTSLAAIVALLYVNGGWLISLLAAALAIVPRYGQTSAFRKWVTEYHALSPYRRRMAYLQSIATGAESALDQRTLGLNKWLRANYSGQADALHARLWKARRIIMGKPFVGYAAFSLAVGIAATFAALVSVGGEAASSRLPLLLSCIVWCMGFGVIFPEADAKRQYGLLAWKSLCSFEGSINKSLPHVDQITQVATTVSQSNHIVFDRVTYEYPNGTRPLDRLDLTFRRGESTAIVGPNGAGKSTLVKLIAGLYGPAEGSVTINGTRSTVATGKVAVQFQDFIRYNLSIAENVGQGSPSNDQDLEGIREVLGQVGLTDLIESLVDGIHTRVGPDGRGRGLSGGQWQRVAMARSLFAIRHGAEILVLDEPTSEMDARAEALFYENFLSITAGVTTVVVSHRFSSVRPADRIVVLENGKIQEDGSHLDLLNLEGRYADFYSLQKSQFGDLS